MHKYSLVLVTILTLFSGCGGGSSDDTSETNQGTTQNQLDTSSVNEPISKTLQEAGYFNVDNVTSIGNSNNYAFTYYKNGTKYFAIYDNMKKEVLSDDLADITGNTITQVTENSVTFDDKTTVNIQNYKKPTITYKPAVNTKSSEQIIKERLGSRFVSFSYTKSKQGAFVYAQSANFDNDYKYHLYLYGLENPSHPIEEKIIRTYTMHYHFDRLVPLDGGKVELYERDGRSPQFKVIYDYIHNNEIHNGFYDIPNNNTQSPQDKIKRQLPGNQYLSRFVTSPQKQAAAVLIKGSGDTIVGLYLYGLDSTQPMREQTIYEPDESGERITDIRFPKSGVVKFTVLYNDWKYYYTYDHFKRRVTDTITINPEGNSQSTQEQVNADNISLTQQFKNDIDNFEWSYSSHVLSPRGNGAVVLAFSDGGYLRILLYGIENNIATQEEELVYENSNITNLQMLSGGRYSYEIRGQTVVKSYL